MIEIGQSVIYCKIYRTIKTIKQIIVIIILTMNSDK